MRIFLNFLCAGLIFSTTLVVAQISTPNQLNSALGTNTQAMVLSLFGVDPLSCPQTSMSQTWQGGKLIFSDSPESPSTRGILYMDTNVTATASLTNRIFVYHVNSNAVQSLRFSVLIKNNGAVNGTLTIQKVGLAGPSTDYPYVGEIAYYRWLTNSSAIAISVAAGQTVRLDTNFDTINVSKNYLLEGIWDYTFTQPHSVIICALNSSDDPIAVGPTLPVLARDVHERGTFATCNKIYTNKVAINTTAGIQQFPIGGNGDSFVTGFDNAVASPTAETDSGNYGVQYQIQMSIASGDGRALGFLVNPRGGAWSGALNVPAGLFPGGSFILPYGDITLSDNTEGVIAAGYSANNLTNILIQFMPTGGASFPVRMLAVPFNTVLPTLAAIGNYLVNVGQTISFVASAGDANNYKSLGFSLANAPSGASIGQTNGIFQWRPPVASAGSSNVLQVIVADNSTPPQTTNRSFAIVVNPLAPTSITSFSKTAGQFQLLVAGTIGPDYILQGNATLTDANGWINLATNTPMISPFPIIDTNVSVYSNRFYRLKLGP
jgi:hypothetical protein